LYCSMALEISVMLSSWLEIGSAEVHMITSSLRSRETWSLSHVGDIIMEVRVVFKNVVLVELLEGIPCADDEGDLLEGLSGNLLLTLREVGSCSQGLRRSCPRSPARECTLASARCL